MKCPHCGTEMEEFPVAGLLTIKAHPVMADSIAAFVAAYPGGLTTKQFIIKVWGAVNPLRAPVTSAHSTMRNLRKVLHPYGWTISTFSPTGPVAHVFKLERIEE